MCHWNGKGFEAIAVTKGERVRHFNAHKLDKDWVAGMDKDCEIPVTPTVTPTPVPPVYLPGSTPPPTHVGRCYGVSQPVIPWAFAYRNGTDAKIDYYVPTTGEGDVVNVVFSENPFEIIFNLGKSRCERLNTE